MQSYKNAKNLQENNIDLSKTDLTDSLKSL